VPQQDDIDREFLAELAEAKGRSDLIAKSLPLKVVAAALTFKSKLPFKALSVREVLIYRVSALSAAAVEMFEQRRLVPAAVLTRAVVETVAVSRSLDFASRTIVCRSTRIQIGRGHLERLGESTRKLLSFTSVLQKTSQDFRPASSC
jgi:uncharacterized YccA/Bax inhibitor family protein